MEMVSGAPTSSTSSYSNCKLRLSSETDPLPTRILHKPDSFFDVRSFELDVIEIKGVILIGHPINSSDCSLEPSERAITHDTDTTGNGQCVIFHGVLNSLLHRLYDTTYSQWPFPTFCLNPAIHAACSMPRAAKRTSSMVRKIAFWPFCEGKDLSISI